MQAIVYFMHDNKSINTFFKPHQLSWNTQIFGNSTSFQGVAKPKQMLHISSKNNLQHSSNIISYSGNLETSQNFRMSSNHQNSSSTNSISSNSSNSLSILGS